MKKQSIFLLGLLITISFTLKPVQASRWVTSNERGAIFTSPYDGDWSGLGAYVGLSSSSNFNRMNPQALKIKHARFHVWGGGGVGADLPADKLEAFEQAEIAAGRDPIFITATYEDKKRDVIWAWNPNLANPRFEGGGSTEMPPQRFEAMKNALGVPIARWETPANNLYQRRTEKGIVFYNVSSSSQIITLPTDRPYYNRSGNLITSITIPDEQGDYITSTATIPTSTEMPSILNILSQWGGAGNADINNDGLVNALDFGLVYQVLTKDSVKVIKTTLLLDNAQRGEYSPDGNKILFMRKISDGTYQIHTANSNGTNIDCLTCSIAEFKGRNVGGGSWHPSMKFISFQAEKPKHIEIPGTESLTHPGIGWYHDIYILELPEKKVYKVTDLPTKSSLLDRRPLTAVLHSHFSSDGKKISWGQSPNLTIRGWFGWEIVVADFVYDETNFEVKNKKIYKPNDVNGYYESDDFSKDGLTLLLSGNLEPNQKPTEMDVYKYNFEDNSLTNLTISSDWDESPIYSFDNNKIAWLSSHDLPLESGDLWWQNGKSEFWIMNSDGTNKQQITTFNKPGTENYTLVGGQRTISNYIEWHPNGNRLLGSITVSRDQNKGFEEKLVVIDILSTFVPNR